MEEENYGITVEAYIEDIRNNYQNDYLVMFKELFDNSLDWGNASKIKILYHNDSLFIIDNGDGIKTNRFKTILKHGKKNKNRTKNTIGKHGRGLNYASVVLSNETIVHTIRQDGTDTQLVDWIKMKAENRFKPDFNHKLSNSEKKYLYYDTENTTGTMIILRNLTEQFKRIIQEKDFAKDLDQNIRRLYYFSHQVSKKILFEIEGFKKDYKIRSYDFKDVLCYDDIDDEKLITFPTISNPSLKIDDEFLEQNTFPLKLKHTIPYNDGQIIIRATFLSEEKLIEDKEKNFKIGDGKKRNFNGIYIQRLTYTTEEDYITRDMVGPVPIDIFGFKEARSNTEDRVKRLRIAIQFTANLDKDFGITILKKFDASRERNITLDLHDILNEHVGTIIKFQSAMCLKFRDLFAKTTKLFNNELENENIAEKKKNLKILQDKIKLFGNILYSPNAKIDNDVKKALSNKKEFKIINDFDIDEYLNDETTKKIAAEQEAQAKKDTLVKAKAEEKAKKYAIAKAKAAEKAKVEAEKAKAKELKELREREKRLKEQLAKAKKDAARKAKEEELRKSKAKKEAVRKAKEEADKKAKEEADRIAKAKKEADKKAKEEALKKKGIPLDDYIKNIKDEENEIKKIIKDSKKRRPFKPKDVQNIHHKQNYRCAITGIRVLHRDSYDIDHKNDDRTDDDISNCQILSNNIHKIKSKNKSRYNELKSSKEEMKKYLLEQALDILYSSHLKNVDIKDAIEIIEKNM